MRCKLRASWGGVYSSPIFSHCSGEMCFASVATWTHEDLWSMSNATQVCIPFSWLLFLVCGLIDRVNGCTRDIENDLTYYSSSFSSSHIFGFWTFSKRVETTRISNISPRAHRNATKTNQNNAKYIKSLLRTYFCYTNEMYVYMVIV